MHVHAPLIRRAQLYLRRLTAAAYAPVWALEIRVYRADGGQRQTYTQLHVAHARDATVPNQQCRIAVLQLFGSVGLQYRIAKQCAATHGAHTCVFLDFRLAC